MKLLLVLFLTFATIGWAMLRPPAHVRAYHLGIELMRAGDFENAANSFSESLSTTRDARVLVARGRAYAQMGDREPSYFAVASRDFRQADELSPRASTIALSGFSLGKLNSHEGAILYYKKSQLGGFQSPGLWNDLGYSYLQTSRLPEAREAFTQAIALDPTFQPAYVNRAKLGLREAVRESRFPEDALKDVKVALSLGSHPEILRDYALILAVASRTDEQYWKQTAEALNEATSAGIDTHTLLEQSMSAPLKSRPEFALYRTPEKPPAPWSPYPVVVDPLGSPASITAED